MKICPVVVQLIHEDRQTDGHTDICTNRWTACMQAS